MNSIRNLLTATLVTSGAVLTAAGAWPAETSLALGQVVQYDLERSREIRKQFPRAYDNVMDNAWRRLESKVAIS